MYAPSKRALVLLSVSWAAGACGGNGGGPAAPEAPMPTEVSTGPVAATQWDPVSWSPDGTKIAFTSSTGDIWVVPSSGGTPTQLTADPARDLSPAWSPDGAKIAFTSLRSGNSTIWVIPVSGGTATPVTTPPANQAPNLGDGAPCWSPDGTKIAFLSNSRSPSAAIWVVAATGGTPKQLTDDQFWDVDPAWSPDGTRIAFSSPRGTNGFTGEIWVVAAGGGAPSRVTVADGTTDQSHPSWSPDGLQLAFDTRLASSTTDRLMVVASTGGAFAAVADGVSPRWSPDGSRIAFRLGSKIFTVAVS